MIDGFGSFGEGCCRKGVLRRRFVGIRYEADDFKLIELVAGERSGLWGARRFGLRWSGKDVQAAQYHL